MGWYYGAHSLKDQIAELIQDRENHKTIAHCVRGNTLWTVGETPSGRYIGCYLLQNGGRDSGWGYKPMEESMGPCEVTCPLSYLDMVPDPGSYATEWRKKVREYHARVGQKIEAGQVVKLTNGQEYRITQVRPLKGVGVKDGVLYKIPRRMLAA